ncbi:MAG: phosphate ABC transporter permease PstA [Armatimonadetes bacterium]|nr:phosphate ABC transporter permease PstA [Armatimonadota bacterium]MCA1997899.1 phosphate ABC transporter permease PstA [Armatimonadota bacterium]
MSIERYRKRVTARGVKDLLFTNLCFVATLIGIVLLAVLLYSVFRDGSQRLSWDFLNSFPSRFPEKAGIKSALFGSLWVVVLTGAIAVPTGIAAAIYLEEFQRRRTWLTELIQVNISNLAGVPSIVYGLLGLAVFVRWMALDRSVISGALTMALLILPMLITVSQEALKAVPESYREGSLALGATQWQTIYRQVLPAALPGILTGVILSLSRALGETAPLILIGAVSFVRFVPEGLGSSFTVLPIQIFNWTSQPQKGFQEAAAAGIIVLLVVLLSLNATAIYLRHRASRHA